VRVVGRAMERGAVGASVWCQMLRCACAYAPQCALRTCSLRALSGSSASGLRRVGASSHCSNSMTSCHVTAAIPSEITQLTAGYNSSINTQHACRSATMSVVHCATYHRPWVATVRTTRVRVVDGAQGPHAPLRSSRRLPRQLG
jgi:hypothetical protein